MAKRIQSPSSINLYKRCPRKYYLHYKLKKPIKPNIHLYRGSIVHSVIHKFEELGLEDVQGYDHNVLSEKLHALFNDAWKEKLNDIGNLGLSEQDVQFYYDDSILMLNNWLFHYIEEQKKGPVNKQTELKLFSSDEYSVMGIIDVIKENDSRIEIIDYKTSKNPVITNEYKLQLAIYALLHEEKFTKRPERVGIHFLKFKDGLKMIEVDDSLINLAKREAKLIHINTISDDPADYPCTCGGWCERDFA